MDNKLGGAAVWTLDLDDFSGMFCNAGDFPLATTMGKTLKAADVKFFQDGFTPVEDEVEDLPTESNAIEPSVATSDHGNIVSSIATNTNKNKVTGVFFIK